MKKFTIQCMSELMIRIQTSRYLMRKRLGTVQTRFYRSIFDGFTIQEAYGGWKNEDGSIAHEYTLVITLSDTTLEKVHSASDDFIKEFHQSSVMIQQNTSQTEFYAGNAK